MTCRGFATPVNGGFAPLVVGLSSAPHSPVVGFGASRLLVAGSRGPKAGEAAFGLEGRPEGYWFSRATTQGSCQWSGKRPRRLLVLTGNHTGELPVVW